ncbi:MAG: methyl-accepting chemotaxis protein, partial [Chrysiogenales bacterium]
MEGYSHPVRRLTITLEVFAYALPVLLLAYFVVIGGDFFSAIGQVIPSVIVGSVVTFSGATYLRWRRLRGPFDTLLKSDADHMDLFTVKRALLMHPRYEALSMAVRYPVGVGIAGAIIALVGEMSMTRFVVIIVGMCMVVPVNAAFFFFQSEISLSRYLKDRRLAAIIIEKDKYRPFRLFPKILFVLLSLLLPPLTILVTFVTLISLGMLRLEYLIIHFIFVSSIMIATSVSAAFFFAKSLKGTISDMERSLDDIARGELGSDFVPMITLDEAGSMSVYVNNLMMKIKEVVSMIQSMSAEL